MELNFETIHELTIDTANGNRRFELLYGNLLAIKTDLWVTTVYSNGQGELFHSIKNKLNLQSKEIERKMVPLLDGGYIGFINHPTQKLLTVNLNKIEGSAIHSDELKLIIQATFSTIASLIYEGHVFHDISLPVIGRKGLKEEEYADTLKWFIHYAGSIFKFSNVTQSIKYFVHLEEDVQLWTTAISHIFDHDVNEPKYKNKLIANVKKSTLQLIDSFPKVERTHVSNTLNGLQKSLSQTPTNYSHLLNLATDLVNSILKDLYRLGISGVEFSKNRLTKMQLDSILKQEPIANWLLNYMYTIRILKENNYFQYSTLANDEKSLDDTILFLLLLQRILTFYKEFYKDVFKK